MNRDEAAWRATAAYLYLLTLQPVALAWEYLRRNPDYRREWRDAHAIAHWGLLRR